MLSNVIGNLRVVLQNERVELWLAGRIRPVSRQDCTSQMLGREVMKNQRFLPALKAVGPLVKIVRQVSQVQAIPISPDQSPNSQVIPF